MSAIVERDLAVGVGEDDVGVLAAELEGDLLHGARGRGHDPLPVPRPPVKETRSTRGSLAQRRTGVRPGAEDQVADAGRQAGLVEQPHQVDRGVRRELAGLEHEGVAGGEARGDLPGRPAAAGSSTA